MKAIQLYFIVFFLLRTIFLVQSCIECSKQVRDELKRYRKKVLPKKVKNSAIRERCDLVIESMETDFFKNYALNHYSGYMESREAERHIEKVLLTMPKVFEFSGSDEEYLDNIVNYRWNILNELKPSLKKAQDKVCSPVGCRSTKYILNCAKCKAIMKGVCLKNDTSEFCSGDRENRKIFENEIHQEKKEMMYAIGLGTAAVAGFLILVFFLTCIISYLRYMNQQVESTTVESEV